MDNIPSVLGSSALADSSNNEKVKNLKLKTSRLFKTKKT